MKLIGVTVVFNEEKMIPYVMPYVEAMGYDKFIVYDDGCTDKTIELLKNYPFVEVREMKMTGKDFNKRKLDTHLDSFSEMYKEYVSKGEETWLTVTDFDEVIFCQRERHTLMKEYIELMSKRGYNYFDGRMLHLTWDGKEKGDFYPHTWDGVRGTWWLTEGKKVTMFKVNDFEGVYMTMGNHNMGVFPRCGIMIKNLDDCGEFHGFHMKYFDKNTILSRSEDIRFVSDAENALNIVRSSSFPMDMYFLMKGLNAHKSPPNRFDNGEGISILKKPE